MGPNAIVGNLLHMVANQLSINLKPVFIGGCDRSGTTFMGALLGAHSQCVTTPESQFIIETFQHFDSYENDLSWCINRITNNWRYKIWDLHVNYDNYDDLGDRVDYSELILFIVWEYSKKISKQSPKIWIDHTPWNTRYALTLHELFPQSKFIHLVRDGRAIAASISQLDWPIVSINRRARFWLERLSFGLAAEKYFGPDNYLSIRFEDLVLEPENTLIKICQFLNIEFQPSLLSGNGFVPPKYTMKQHSLVGTPPDPDRVLAWKKQLSAREIEIFEYITGDMLSYLGYTRMFDGKAKPPSLKDEMIMNLEQFFKGTFNFLRMRNRRRKSLKLLGL